MEYVHLTKDIRGWSECKTKLLKIARGLEYYYNKEVIVWGGGGSGSSTAILKRVELEPTIIKNKHGYTLRAHLQRVTPPTSPYDSDKVEWTPWLGSWQISAEGHTIKK